MNRRLPSLVLLLVAVLLALLVSPLAYARVRHDGQWPAQEKPVSLKLAHTPRAEAVRQLARAAGWSVIVHAPPGDPVDVDVTDVAPSKILDMLLSDRNYVAERDGSIMSIMLDDASAPATPISSATTTAALAPPTPSAPPAPPADAVDPSAQVAASGGAPSAAQTTPIARVAPANRGKDRNLTGENLRIGKDEVVQDVVVFGGNVDVFGTVTGDISVTGGNLRVHETGWIIGDAAVIGGNFTIDGASEIDGDVSVIGGNLKRSDGCKIGGDVETRGSEGHGGGGGGAGGAGGAGGHGGGHGSPGHLNGVLGGIGGAITRGAMLFVFGAVLLALAAKKMETLRVEVASRPMRSFAMGVVGILGAVVLFIAFCVTIIGIPIALIGLFLGVIGGYAGVCAVLTVVGQALLKHKTESPYVHLAVGCALFMFVGAIPFVGTLVTVAIALVGIGVLVATRAAGLLPKKNGAPNSGPYRTAEA